MGESQVHNLCWPKTKAWLTFAKKTSWLSNSFTGEDSVYWWDKRASFTRPSYEQSNMVLVMWLSRAAFLAVIDGNNYLLSTRKPWSRLFDYQFVTFAHFSFGAGQRSQTQLKNSSTAVHTTHCQLHQMLDYSCCNLVAQPCVGFCGQLLFHKASGCLNWNFHIVN